MRIIARRTLREFWRSGHAEAEQPLKSWFAQVSRASWASPASIKRSFPHASIIDRERAVFNIGGNKFRLVVKIWFEGKTVWIKFIGTHAEYDKLNISSL